MEVELVLVRFFEFWFELELFNRVRVLLFGGGSRSPVCLCRALPAVVADRSSEFGNLFLAAYFRAVLPWLPCEY